MQNGRRMLRYSSCGKEADRREHTNSEDAMTVTSQVLVFESQRRQDSLKTNFVTDSTINLPEKHGSVVDVFLTLIICFNLIIHLGMC